MLSAIPTVRRVPNPAGSERSCAVQLHAQRQPAAWQLSFKTPADIQKGLRAPSASSCCKYVCIVMAGFPHLHAGPMYCP